MPSYKITAPDGHSYKVTVPEGATEQDALKHLQSQLGASNKPADPYKETAQKQSILQNLAAGAGGGMYGLYLGAKQLLGKATPEEIEDHRRAMEGLRSTTSGTIGEIGGTVAAALPTAFIPGANTYTGSALIGGGLGALQPTRSEESKTENAVLGALGGVAGKAVGDKILKLLGGRSAVVANQMAMQSDETLAGLNPAQQEVLRKGQKLGFKATPGQATGSKTLQKFEATLESNPFTAGAFEDIKTANAQTLNKIAARAIGEESGYVNSTVLNQAKDRISDVYKEVADTRVRQLPIDDFAAKFSSITDEFEGLLPMNLGDNPVVKRFVEFANSGQATGEQLQTIASKLGNIAHKNMTTPSGDRDLGMALFKVKDIADDYLRIGLPDNIAQKFDTARTQYRNLMMLTGREGIVNSSSGDVSKAALPRMLAAKDKPGYVYGKNQSDFYNAARFGDAFKPIVGDSGTATRSMGNLSLENLAKLPFGMVVRLYASQPVTNTSAAYMNMLNQGISPDLAALLQQPIRKGLPLTGAYLGSTANQ